MFEKITPEQAGYSSKKVTEFIKKMEKYGSVMHSLLMMKDGKIFTEAYWKPFHQDFCHRMYSQTKSFVSIAIGLLEEEGKLSLDDEVVKYFPEKIDGQIHPYLEKQTIRDMLMMATVGLPSIWFFAEDSDRTHMYLNEKRKMHASGMFWDYDSAGSQVLSTLVEKLSGKNLLAYLREKLFNVMGTFQTACILKTANGDTWGDSAMVCTARDMASFGHLVMNYGVWQGTRLMNEKYLREATTALIDNSIDNGRPIYSGWHQGYGYKIWRICGNGFAFIGMGDQITACYPDKKLVVVWNADNQGTSLPLERTLTMLEEMFIEQDSEEPLTENQIAFNELENLISGLKLYSVTGKDDSIFRMELNEQVYICEPNPMGITRLSFIFKDKESGELHYTNAQGDKVLPFGVNKNVFGKFPQLGYSNEFGGVVTTDGFMYNDAVSLAWIEDKKILLCVQIIDRYFGNLHVVFSFKEDLVYAKFYKVAEAFLEEYHGELIGNKFFEGKQ